MILFEGHLLTYIRGLNKQPTLKEAFQPLNIKRRIVIHLKFLGSLFTTKNEGKVTRGSYMPTIG